MPINHLIQLNFQFECNCRKIRAKRSGKNEFMPFDENDTATDFDEKNFQLSIHLSGGIFRSEFFSFFLSLDVLVFNCFKIYNGFVFFPFLFFFIVALYRYRYITVIQMQATSLYLG